MANMNPGLKLLIKRRREEFCRENRKLYSDKDYKRAERKFIKLCLRGATSTSSSSQ